MKSAFCFLFVLSIYSPARAFKDGPLGLQMPSYNVTRDVISDKVPEDKCLIKGRVYYDYLPLDSVEIATLDRGVRAFSADSGKYEMYVEAGDTSIFAYRKFKGEVVIWNYNFQGGHEVEIDFYFNSVSQMVITAKPVIYLYAPEDIQAQVSFRAASKVTHTYPHYNDGWSVEVKKNGDLRVDEKNYPYLFWEGEHEGYVYEATEGKVAGFLIDTDKIIPFLEEKLGILGLNHKEQTDFITFWAPKLKTKEFAFIQFLVDDGVSNTVSELIVDPKPDSQRRVYMLCTPLDSNILPTSNTFVPQQLENFERKGFSVIEWGGSIINLNFEEL